MKLEFVANCSLALRIKKSEEQVVIRDQPKKGGYDPQLTQNNCQF